MGTSISYTDTKLESINKHVTRGRYWASMIEGKGPREGFLVDSKSKLPDELLNTSVEGRNLRGKTVGDQLNGEWQLLVFLRHLG